MTLEKIGKVGNCELKDKDGEAVSIGDLVIVETTYTTPAEFMALIVDHTRGYLQVMDEENNVLDVEPFEIQKDCIDQLCSSIATTSAF